MPPRKPSARAAAAPAEPPPPTISPRLLRIPQIFQEAQASASHHRKLAIALHKAHQDCLAADDADGERTFISVVSRLMNHLLPVKRTEPVAGRVIRFFAYYLKLSAEKDAALDDGNVFSEERDMDTPLNRAVVAWIRHLLPGTLAKDKFVRFRVCQLLAILVQYVGEIDTDVFDELKHMLVARLSDKEASVRVQAATALCCIASTEDEEDPAAEETQQLLINSMRTDPSADVRRAIIMSITPTMATLPFLMERAHDTDPLTRRLVFAKPMSLLEDFRILSLNDRERLLRQGVADRDPRFLERIDVIGSTIAADMMSALFISHPEMIQGFAFDDEFWTNLSVEGSFLLRCYTQHCHRMKETDMTDDLLPELTKQAIYIQRYNNLWLEADEDDKPDLEFIVEQLLVIARHMNFAEETGRRNMLNLMREVILIEGYPENLVAAAIEVLRCLLPDERDFLRIVMEIISEIRDGFLTSDEDQVTMTQLTQESQEDNEAMFWSAMKCLHITKCVLEKMKESFTQNATMHGLVNSIIIPLSFAPHPALRENSVICLGHCCYLDKTLAIDKIHVFLHAVRNGHIELQVAALKIVFDLVMLYGFTPLSGRLDNDTEIYELVTECSAHEENAVMNVAVQGVCKLLLSNIFTDSEALKSLVLLYFHPTTADNVWLRQCLSFFLQTYGQMSQLNQENIAKFFVIVWTQLCYLYDSLDEKDTMVNPTQIIQQAVDWTDHANLYLRDGAISSTCNAHCMLGIDMLKCAYTENDRGIRKVLMQAICSLHLDDTAEMQDLQKMSLLAGWFPSRELEPATAKTLGRFTLSLKKLLPEFDPRADHKEDAVLEDIFEFIRESLSEDVADEGDESEAEEQSSEQESEEE